VAAFISTVCTVLVFSSFVGFQKDTVNPRTLGTRLFVWKLGLAELAAHPLTGIGYGNDSFLKKYPQFSPELQAQLPEREEVIPAMHSAFLMVAVGSGIPAFLCFVWIFVRLIRMLLLRSPGTDASGQYARFSFAIGLALLGFGVRNCFDYMFMGSLAHLFWILAAVGMSVQAMDVRVPESRTFSHERIQALS
jgi:O-antigen ligase